MGASSSGAKDAYGFEHAARGGYFPHESSLSHEGVFYHHYFKTGSEEERTFSVQCAGYRSEDPLSHQDELFISIGLNSKYDGDGIKRFGRRPVNLVFVLDTSGSMDSGFSGDVGEEGRKTKLEAACARMLSLPIDWVVQHWRRKMEKNGGNEEVYGKMGETEGKGK